jgi:hypothetical protein
MYFVSYFLVLPRPLYFATRQDDFSRNTSFIYKKHTSELNKDGLASWRLVSASFTLDPVYLFLVLVRRRLLLSFPSDVGIPLCATDAGMNSQYSNCISDRWRLEHT